MFKMELWLMSKTQRTHYFSSKSNFLIWSWKDVSFWLQEWKLRALPKCTEGKNVTGQWKHSYQFLCSYSFLGNGWASGASWTIANIRMWTVEDTREWFYHKEKLRIFRFNLMLSYVKWVESVWFGKAGRNLNASFQ